MTDDEREVILETAIDQWEQADPELSFPGDPVLDGAIRIINHFGLWYDPPLSPETALTMARLVLGDDR